MSSRADRVGTPRADSHGAFHTITKSVGQVLEAFRGTSKVTTHGSGLSFAYTPFKALRSSSAWETELGQLASSIRAASMFEFAKPNWRHKFKAVLAGESPFAGPLSSLHDKVRNQFNLFITGSSVTRNR